MLDAVAVTFTTSTTLVKTKSDVTVIVGGFVFSRSYERLHRFIDYLSFISAVQQRLGEIESSFARIALLSFCEAFSEIPIEL